MRLNEISFSTTQETPASEGKSLATTPQMRQLSGIYKYPKFKHTQKILADK